MWHPRQPATTSKQNLLGLMISPPQGHYYLINSPLERNTQPKGNQVTDIDFSACKQSLERQKCSILGSWRETHGEEEGEGNEEREREAEREKGRGRGRERGGECKKEIEERKVRKKATSDDEPLCRRCTKMPLIRLSLVRGRHSDQRSCIDNPKRGARSDSANKSP